MGDEDDGGAGVLELAHDRHELVGLLRREHGGRLIEDEDLRVPRERLDDLNALLHPDGQLLDERVGVDVEPEPLRDLPDALPGRIQVEEPSRFGGFVTEHHVLSDGEHRDQHEVLVHHADARAHGVAGTVKVLDVIVEEDRALVGLVQTVENVHQR